MYSNIRAKIQLLIVFSIVPPFFLNYFLAAFDNPDLGGSIMNCIFTFLLLVSTYIICASTKYLLVEIPSKSDSALSEPWNERPNVGTYGWLSSRGKK